MTARRLSCRSNRTFLPIVFAVFDVGEEFRLGSHSQ